MESVEEVWAVMQEIDRLRRKRESFENNQTMKLFCCTKCSDVLRCVDELRTCQCGKSSGQYIDNANAVFKGKYCVPMGIDNPDFGKAIQAAKIENKYQKEPTTCKGVDFLAFVILDCSTTITRK